VAQSNGRETACCIDRIHRDMYEASGIGEDVMDMAVGA
jgi:hypothetical protein